MKFTGIRIDNGEIVEGGSVISFRETGECFIGPAGAEIEGFLDENGNIDCITKCLFVAVYPDIVECIARSDDFITNNGGEDG